MFRKLTSLLMIGALALSAAATSPASARDRSDNGNLIAGLAIGAIVGAALANNNNNNNNNSRRDNRDGYVSRGYAGNPYERNQVIVGDHNRGRADSFNYRRPAALPGACRVYAGNRSGYSGRCLSRSYRAYGALPSACAVRVGGHHRTIFRDQCLNRYGFY